MTVITDEEEPDFSDPPGFVDDIDDNDLIGDILDTEPKEALGIESVVIVDNLPVTNRVTQLQKVVRKKLSSDVGNITNDYWPLDDEGKTKGYAFLEFDSHQQAVKAVQLYNNSKLDKAHVLAVNLFTDFDKYENTESSNWTPPEPKSYVDHGDLRSWLLDEECRDQYSVLSMAPGPDNSTHLAIYWNAGSAEPEEVHSKTNWTFGSEAGFSPLGSYLLTTHEKGVAIWGGSDFHRIERFPHDGAQHAEMSPCERYLVTFSPHVTARQPHHLIVWAVRTAQRITGFKVEQTGRVSLPILKWSHNGNYMARMTHDSIQIIDVATCKTVRHKAAHVRDFQWSPIENLIAYWAPSTTEEGPARVVILAIPDKVQDGQIVESQAKNLFNVADCQMYWQKEGQYLCVKVDRYAKLVRSKEKDVKYAGLYCNYELFRVCEKDIPVDVLEVKEKIWAFAWEPVGHRFAFIHGTAPRICVSVYKINPRGKIQRIGFIEKRQVNQLFWSPTGNFLVLAGMRDPSMGMDGDLFFYDVNEMHCFNEYSSTALQHSMMSHVEWDPSGRYVVTLNSFWHRQVDNGFFIWSFQGTLLRKVLLERFCMLKWRARPPSMLTEANLDEIRKNMKKYRAQFDAQDRASLTKASKEIKEKRRRQWSQYEHFMTEAKQQLNGQMDDEVELVEEAIEFLIEAEETVEE